MSRLYDHGGNVFTVARSLGVEPGQILDFSASINPLGMSPMVRDALVGSLDTLLHYPDSSHTELKEALARFHGLSAANFTIANGSTELIHNLPALLSGDKALILSPSFSEYVSALSQHKWEITHLILKPEDGFLIDMEKLRSAISSGVDLLFICNPGNPAGLLYPPQVIEKIQNICLAAGTFMILDEAFMDFCEGNSAKRMIALGDNAVVLRSMTKFFSIPGLRLGYAISNANFADRLDQAGGPWRINSLALIAGVAALQDVLHNQKSLEFIRQERCRLFEGLGKFPQLRPYPSSANYLLVEIMGEITSCQLKERLLRQRILIRDCAGFAGLSDKFFRIAVRTIEENNKLLKCLRDIFNEYAKCL